MSALTESLNALARLAPLPADDFDGIRSWVTRLLEARWTVVSLLLSLEPFEPFDLAQGSRVLGLIETIALKAAEALEGGTPYTLPVDDLLDVAIRWANTQGTTKDSLDALGLAFGMPRPPVDDAGAFRSDWVLQHYAYATDELLPTLVPNLASFGLSGVTDVLAGVTIVGGILDCQDPVVAYVQLDSFLRRFAGADPDVATKARAHLDCSEPALRRTSQLASRALAAALDESVDLETRVMGLVDAYKRLLEGPFRQFSWALHCLSAGTWENPPMVSSLRDRLMADGGGLGSIARDVVIPDLRNSETHETLVWDGFREELVTDGGRVKPGQVAFAFAVAESFIHGCEAGLAAVRTLDARPDTSPLPDANETGRMPAARRVVAYFGTNKLRVVESSLNTRQASLRLEQLAWCDVNPCFQALTVAHRLMPDIETFSISTSHSGEPLLVVSAESLAATMPVWEFAVSNLDQMPLSAFLAVNFDARSRIELPTVALRSVAWIAADDALDAIDGGPDTWDDSARLLLDTRLHIVQFAIERTGTIHDIGPRLESVRTSVGEIRLLLAGSRPGGPASIDHHPALTKLRVQWERWGPVLRHPLVPEDVSASVVAPPPRPRRLPDSRTPDMVRSFT